MSFWRKDLPVIGEEKQVEIGGMWEHQQEWWELPNFIKVLVTGYGGGKTMIAAKRAISLALQNAPSPHIWVSPNLKVARRTVIPMLRALLNGKQTLEPRLRWTYHRTDYEFKIQLRGRTGIIWVLSGDDPEMLKGPNAGSGTIDEPFIQNKLVFDQINARIRDPAAKVRELDLTGTPEQMNWGYDICEGDDRDKHDLGLVQASSSANLALPDDYVKRLREAFTEKAAAAYIDGAFIALTEGLVYYAFGDHNVVKKERPDGAELGAGMDFNVNPMAAVLFWKHKDHMHIYREIELPNSDTQDMCGLLRSLEGDKLKNVYPDASGRSRHTNAPAGKTDFVIIRDEGFTIRCHSNNPKLRDRYNSVNGRFKIHEEKDSAGNTISGPRLTIDPGCKKLISYLKQYSHEDMNKEQQKAMSHLLDAATYPVAYLFPAYVPLSAARLVGHAFQH